MSVCISSRLFENQPNEICSHLSEKASKGMFPMPEKLQNHSNEGKLRKGEKERTRRRKGGEKKSNNKKKQKVHLAIKLSKIRLDMYIYFFLANK